MYTATSAKEKLLSGAFDKTFSTLYSDNQTVIKTQSKRYSEAVDEFVSLFSLTYVRFYDADRRNIFLNRSIQFVIFRGCHAEIFGSTANQEKETDAQEENCHKVDTCNLFVDCKCHDQRADHAG